MNNHSTILKLRQFITKESIDDPELINILIRSGCLGILSNNSSWKERIKATLMFNHISQSIAYASCERLFNDLDKIDYAVIKGAVLSSRIYNNPNMRLSSDIDILISPNTVKTVIDLLSKNGFVQGYISNGQLVPYTKHEIMYYKTFTHQIAPFIKKNNNKFSEYLSIDINTNIFWGESNQRINMDDFLTNCDNIKIFNVTTKRLSPVYEFISLCMHHYKDLNSIYLLWERGVNLSLFCDIYYYIINVIPNIIELKSVSDELGISDYVYYCLYHTNVIFDDSRFQEYISTFETQSGNNILNRIGLNEHEYKFLPYGITHYLFDNNFKEALASHLSPKDIRKIEINKQYM